MALTIDDILGQLGSLFNGGEYAGNGVTTFAAPGNADSLNGMTASGGLLGNGMSQTFNNTGKALPQAPTGGGLGSGLGMNLGTAQLALGGLSALGSIFGANQASKLAKDQFKFTKDVTNTNLNNQIKSYNTALEDRITARAAMQGNDSSYVSDYLAKNRLSR